MLPFEGDEVKTYYQEIEILIANLISSLEIVIFVQPQEFRLSLVLGQIRWDFQRTCSIKLHQKTCSILRGCQCSGATSTRAVALVNNVCDL